MRRGLAVIAWCLVGAFGSSLLSGHPGHVHVEGLGALHPGHTHSRPAALIDGVSGQGSLRFRVLYTSSELPQAARSVLENAHGGFAVDRRPGRGEVYFALPGAGIVRISANLGSIDLLDTEPGMREANLHNTTLWEASDGTPYLSFPANDAGRIFTTTLSGALVHTLESPGNESDFGEPSVNEYFRAGNPFTPTDVDYHRGTLFVTTGYSELDWVLTARVGTGRGSVPIMAWHDLAFGGRGTSPGQLGTGHGVTIVVDPEVRVDIADRPNAEIDRFTPAGDYASTLALPEGSWPCDIDYLDDYAVVGALYGPDRDKGAPIYVLQNDRVVSEIWPKDELGLSGFQHLHNAVLTKVRDRLVIIAQAWNPGDFAVLEQVVE